MSKLCYLLAFALFAAAFVWEFSTRPLHGVVLFAAAGAFFFAFGHFLERLGD